MLKYILLILLIIIVCLLMSNEFLTTKLRINEHQKQTDALNLSGSLTKKRNQSLINESTNSSNQHSVQRTCCNFNYELSSNQYSLTKLSRICDLIPIEIKCMQKCIEIKKDKRVEFNLEVSNQIEEWIEHRLSFQEVICFKIKKELNFHSKQASINNIVPINNMASIENQISDINRLSKEEVFNLIKNLSFNLGLNQLNSFENEFILNDQKSNKFIVNSRGVEILKQIRIISKLLSEENQERLRNAKERDLNQANKLLSNSNQFKQHFNQLNVNSKLAKPQFQQTDHLKVKPNQFQQTDHLKVKPNQFQQNLNPYNYYHQNQFINPNRRKNIELDEIQTESATEINKIDSSSDQIDLIESDSNQTETINQQNESTEDYNCLKIRLNESAVNYLRKNYPNITIVKINDSNELNQTVKMNNNNQLKPRGLLSMLGFGSDRTEDKKSDDLIATRLFPLFSPTSHDSINKIANQTLESHSTSCQLDFQQNLNDLLILNLKLKHSSNDFRQSQTSGLIDLCNELQKLGDQLENQLKNCKQSPEMNFMIEHTINETEKSFKYCLDFELKNKLADTKDHIVHSESKKINHLELDEKEISQLNVNEIDHELIECLNWNKLRSCQSTFIPWFELISTKEFQQLIDNKSMKFDDLNLFRQNSFSFTFNESSSSNCKDVLLFENCVKEDLDDFINLDFKTGKLVESEDHKNLTCQFGAKRMNKIKLVNDLTNRITKLINDQMSSYCPKMKVILSLVAGTDPNERDNYYRNIIKYYSDKYIDIVNDQECSESTVAFKEYCIQTHINHLKPTYVQFYKNLELQTYFKAFVSNQYILPRICCAQRQLARCFNSAANFKCSKNPDRTSKLINEIGKIEYCNEFDAKISMNQCRNILSMKTQTTSASASSNNSLSTFLSILLLIIFIFKRFLG